MKRGWIAAAAALALLTGMVGCASKGYVDEQMGIMSQDMGSRIETVRSETGSDIDNVEQDVTMLRDEMSAKEREILALKEATREQERKLEASLDLAREAVDRAENASKLVKGNLLYEVTLSDAAIPFAYNKSALSQNAQAALDAFAEALLSENRPVYIEIQGHTDATGPHPYNLALGRDRAEAVMRHLHVKHQIPLSRMSAFSYGETKPVASNKTKQGRAQNRRVVMLVME